MENVEQTTEQAENHLARDVELVSAVPCARVPAYIGGTLYTALWPFAFHILTPYLESLGEVLTTRLKDSDVTWLYGPLHTAQVEPVRPLKVATADERLGIDLPASPKVKPGGLKKSNSMRAPSKPILKHRTLSEMLTIPNPSSPVLEASRYDDDDSSSDSHGGTARPPLIQTKSDTNIANSRTAAVRYRSPPRMPISGKVSPNATVPTTTPAGEKTANAEKEKRHISFNTFVEQCVALSEPELPAQESDSDDDMLEIRSNSSRSSRGSRPSLSRNSSTGSGSSEHLTIAKIAPTMLKTNGTFVSSHLPQMVYAPPPEYQSPREEQPTSANFDFPSPQVQKRDRWAGDDDDEYGSVGYDYFGGPNLGGTQQQNQAAPSHVGASYGRSSAPTVNQAPAQPKWRQPSSSTNSSEPSSVSSSSSASLNNVSSPPVPSRGILKVRPPGSTPPEPASPPQSSYFNYNPSPATGIGGMRGSYEYPNTLDESHRSPLQSPGTEETRGRSAQRYPGASAYDRSASRGTSTSSTSPGSVRTPPIDTTGSRRSVASPGAGSVQSPPIPYQAHVQAAAPVGLNNPAYSAQQSNNAPSMDVDEPYQPERSNTPTPHSSPQVRRNGPPTSSVL